MFTPITDASLSIYGQNTLGAEKTWRPARRWNLGLDAGAVSNQVQQLKTATAITSPLSGSSSTVNNQGQAKPVQNLRVTRRSISRTQYQVSISFTPDPNDRYFQGVAVSLTQGDNTPLQVAFGKQSPITFVVTKGSSPSAVNVQSVGSLGDTPIKNSPSRGIALQA
jgi:hypothetical protein